MRAVLAFDNLAYRRLETWDGELVEEIEAAPGVDVGIDPEHLNVVKAALVQVVEAKRGTGARARVAGVAVGGKTGTTQVVGLEVVEGMEDDEIPIHYRDHAWFVAFAPVEDPQIVVAVLVEHGGGGGSTAAPVAQRVLQAFAETRGIVPLPPESKLATLRADPAGGAHAVD